MIDEDRSGFTRDLEAVRNHEVRPPRVRVERRPDRRVNIFAPSPRPGRPVAFDADPVTDLFEAIRPSQALVVGTNIGTQLQIASRANIVAQRADGALRRAIETTRRHVSDDRPVSSQFEKIEWRLDRALGVFEELGKETRRNLYYRKVQRAESLGHGAEKGLGLFTHDARIGIEKIDVLAMIELLLVAVRVLDRHGQRVPAAAAQAIGQAIEVVV